MTPVVAASDSVGRGERAGAVAPASLEAWTEKYGDELRHHIRRMVASEADADDLLQEVWVKAIRRPPDSGPGSNVRAWLYRVATNAALDCLSKCRRRSRALDGRRLELAPEAAAAPDAALGELSEVARERVRKRVSLLPPKQREAVWLRWVEGLDYERIAARLDCSRASARANVYNGMKKLRVELCEIWTKENGG